jgi:hypothetical protein
MADDLDAILARAGLDGTELRREQAGALARAVSQKPEEEFITTVVAAPGTGWDDGQQRPRDYLEVHTGRWHIDLRDPANRRHLVLVTVAAVLVDALNLTERTSWVSAVLPAVADVGAVRAVPGGLHVELVRLTDPQVPTELAALVNVLDFTDFVAAVHRAGPVVAIPAGGTITFSGSTPR